MQSLPPPPSPASKTVQSAPTPASPYQPAAGFQQSGMSYSFRRWLMMGVILLIASVVFVEIVAMDGAPSAVDYNMELDTDTGLQIDPDVFETIAKDTESHTDVTRVISSVSSILQAFGLGMIGYALLRESHDDKHEHTALRVTAIIVGVLILTNIAARDLSLF